MNRRSLLLLSTLLGGFFPLGALAQDPATRVPTRRPTAGGATRTARRTKGDEADGGDDNPAPPTADRDEIPPNFLSESGHQWKTFDISKYMALDHKDPNPQKHIVDWIFRRTDPSIWHGEKIAVLSAGRTKIRAYHNAKVLDQVSEVVERFTDADTNALSVRVRLVAANDTRWRYTVYKRLKFLSSGPQGQQVWTVKPDDAAMIFNQLQLTQGARLLADRVFDMMNGQTAVLYSTAQRPYTGTLQRDNAAAQGFQPKAEELEEGVTLRISPLLSFDGDNLDAGMLLTTNNVRTFHQTRVLAPKEVGPGEARIDVPEVSQTQLNQTVRAWPIGETLLISAGIQPGILQAKGGMFNMRIPGTVPTSTELLVFVDVDRADDREARRDDRGRARK
jgi:hypothetical protein